MTLGEWIHSRPPAPPALAARMRPEIDAADARGGALEHRALAAALSLLDDMVEDETEVRTGAITLLAADALMTYAFEAGAARPQGIDSLASDAMIRISTSAVRS